MPAFEVDDIAELAGFYRDPPDGVRANMIFSVDGAASLHGRAGPLSDSLDHQLLLALRGYADVVLVGAGTARAENYGPVRLTDAQRSDRWERWALDEPPPIAVVSQSGKLPPSLFAEPSQPPMVITSSAAAAGLRFEGSAVPDVVIAGENGVDVATTIAALRARGLRRVLCEGGPTLLDELVLRGLVDEMCVTIAPKLAGTGQSATSAGLPQLPAAQELSLHHVLTHQGYLFLKYGRAGHPSSAVR
ncbi:pyrimidine reductase family protein [Mycobacterium conspicuum]|nr:pyrimidine reductase family protein [Mycobacterium conspicuum]